MIKPSILFFASLLGLACLLQSSPCLAEKASLQAGSRDQPSNEVEEPNAQDSNALEEDEAEASQNEGTEEETRNNTEEAYDYENDYDQDGLYKGHKDEVLIDFRRSKRRDAIQTDLNVEWFGLMAGFGNPVGFIRMQLFKLIWESAYWTLIDGVMIDFSIGMSAGWRKQLNSTYELRLGLGVRWGIWLLEFTPWVRHVNPTNRCTPIEDNDLISGVITEPQFAFLRRYRHVFLGAHLSVPIMVGNVEQQLPLFKKTSYQWSPGLQVGLYLSFY